MHKRLVVLAVAATIVVVFALPSIASADSQTVWAGGPPAFQSTVSQFGAEANDFFPREVAVHVGDTVTWKGMSLGFHTIDLPGRSGADLPVIIPNGQTTTGVNDFAGNPFWFNGLPVVGINPSQFAPIGSNTYDGSERVAAGLPLTDRPFRVTFTKPGTYVYFCDIHYDMHGVIIVRPKSQTVPSGATYAALVDKQVSRDTQEAQLLANTTVTGRVSLGLAGRFNVEVLAMFPSTLHVKAGSTVTFSMSPRTGETHTATFGPDQYLGPILGSFAGFGPFDSRGVYSSSPPGMPIVISPTAHGNGFGNAGTLDRDESTPLPPSAKFTFTTPGTYHFLCLIHPFMQGTIVVRA